jgi:8-oxo-dGTP diphosphatase
LLMPLYVCRKWEGQIVPREGQAVSWKKPRALFDMAMPPADIPLIAALRDAI